MQSLKKKDAIKIFQADGVVDGIQDWLVEHSLLQSMIHFDFGVFATIPGAAAATLAPLLQLVPSFPSLCLVAQHPLPLLQSTDGTAVTATHRVDAATSLRNVALATQDFSFTEFVAATFNRKKCLTEKVGRVIFNSYLAFTAWWEAVPSLLACLLRLRQKHGWFNTVELLGCRCRIERQETGSRVTRGCPLQSANL